MEGGAVDPIDPQQSAQEFGIAPPDMSGGSQQFNLPWAEYFDATGMPHLINQLGSGIALPGFERGLAWLLPQVPMPVLRTYLRWQLTSSVASIMTHDFARERSNFAETLAFLLDPSRDAVEMARIS